MEDITRYNQYFFSPLTAGGQASLFDAFYLPTNQLFVAKVFNISDLAGQNALLKEIAVHERMFMKSDRLCQVVDCFFIDNEAYIVMEKYERDLYNHVHEKHHLNSTNQKRIMFRRICRGIKHLHRQGVAHLDIKEENILLDINYNPFICDFGLSVHFPFHTTHFSRQQRKKSFVRGTNGLGGTRFYIAPEIVAREEFVNPFAADIYSLGTLLHTLLTGSYPAFQHDAELDTSLLQHLELEPSCCLLLKSMLSFSPKERPSIERILANEWVTNSFC